eukprot:gene29900-51963_t
MNNNIKELSHKVIKDDDETTELKVSKFYNIMKSDEENNIIIHFINDLEDITKLIKKYTNKEKKQIKLKLITNQVDKILIQSYKAGYTPRINFMTEIYNLTFEIDYFYIVVEKVDITALDEPDIEIDNVEEYKTFSKANYEFYQSMLQKDYLSSIHPTINNIEDTYRINACTGSFENNKGQFIALDENKAYTECLMNLSQ